MYNINKEVFDCNSHIELLILEVLKDIEYFGSKEDIFQYNLKKTYEYFKQESNERKLSIYDPWLKMYAIEELVYIFKNLWKYEYIYNAYFSVESKKIFDWLEKRKLAYAFVGEYAFEIYKYPIRYTRYRKLKKKQKGLYGVNDIEIDSEIDVMRQTWEVEQYSFPPECVVQKGDYVIDAGAYCGETTIWFVHKIGINGRVYAFEPDDRNCIRLENNLTNNKINNVVIEKKALWKSRVDLSLESRGASSQISKVNGGKLVQAISIDEYVERNNIDKVDFIKMDIEGAEYNALLGARKTICKFKPKLAISIYHKANDFIEIPILIKKFNNDYRIELAHNNSDNNFIETILFAFV